MKKADLYWLSGLLEGEGAFTFELANGRPRIHLDMTDRDIIERAAVLMGVPKIYQRRRPQNKPVFLLRLGGRQAIGLMRTLAPLMGYRRRAKIEWILVRYAGRSTSRGWSAHRAKHGCKCQSNTGSSRRARPVLVETLP